MQTGASCIKGKGLQKLRYRFLTSLRLEFSAEDPPFKLEVHVTLCELFIEIQYLALTFASA